MEPRIGDRLTLRKLKKKLLLLNVQKLTHFFQMCADILCVCQTIWISDEAQRLVGPHLDNNCLQISKFTASGHRVNFQNADIKSLHFCDCEIAKIHDPNLICADIQCRI